MLSFIEKKRKTEEGFTLLEVILAIFVLSVGVVSIVALMAGNLSTFRLARERVIAAHLAQEGIEVVRGIRNTNWLNDEDYDANMGGGIPGWGGPDLDLPELPGVGPGLIRCVDYDSEEVMRPCMNSRLYWDDNNKRYVHDNSFEATQYVRQIIVQRRRDTDLNEYLRIISLVFWDNGRIAAEEHLYDWR